MIFLKRLSFVLLLSLSVQTTNAQFSNLVLEGGGMRGLAYAGAVMALDSLNITQGVSRIAGTSSGALNGLLLAVGYTGVEMQALNLKTNFGKYKQVGVPIASGLVRMNKKFGYYKTDRLIEDLGALVEAKGISRNITFGELKQAYDRGERVKLLYVTGVNVTDGEVIIFSHENFPKMPILDAVRISISIPLFFEAVFMQPDGTLVKSKQRDSLTKVMTDGGVVDNYPFHVFDTLVTAGGYSYYKCNKQTLGIKLEINGSKETLQRQHITSNKDFILGFSQLSSEYRNRRRLGEPQLKQTVFIDTQRFNSQLRRVSKTNKMIIMRQGYKAVNEFFMQNSYSAQGN